MGSVIERSHRMPLSGISILSPIGSGGVGGIESLPSASADTENVSSRLNRIALIVSWCFMIV